MNSTTFTKSSSISDLNQRNKAILQTIKKYSIVIRTAKNLSSATKLTRELKHELLLLEGFGYIRVENLIQLSSMCGFLPGICYIDRELPHSPSSGSNRFVSKLFPNASKKEMENEFNKAVRLIQKCCTKRLFQSDIENVMCELNREDRNCRKVECIFFEKSSGKIQNFFRVFKTNLSKHTCVTKYQVQILHQSKWLTLENEIKPVFFNWTSENDIFKEMKCTSTKFNKPF